MRLEYVGIRVIDMDESIKFYTELLNMKLLARTKIPTTKGEVATLQSPGSSLVLELNYYEEGSPFATSYDAGEGLDHLGFRVDDLRATLEILREKGVRVALEPFEETDEKGVTGTLAFIQDPNGIWIELYQ
ncbi:MAG: VOC family protein [Candidatus Bathyarchaeia archaeon]